MAEPLEYASSCVIPTSWLALPLLAKREYNHNSTIYTFGLPDNKSLSLPVCACLLLKAPGKGRKDGGGKDDFDGSDAARPYTPISDNSMLGKFELLIKRYEGGAVSQYLHSLEPQATVEFKHIKFNVKAPYPFEGKSNFTMLCAGTGVAPIYQALHKLMRTPGDSRKVTVIYGNLSPEDILLRTEIDEMVKAAPDRLKVVHVVGKGPDDPLPSGFASGETFTAASGWIDEAKIKEHAFPPSEDTMVFVCGLPGMYASLCGPRNEKAIAEGTVLHKLGYTETMVAKM
jgi:cytochrome-b5 reductase